MEQPKEAATSGDTPATLPKSTGLGGAERRGGTGAPATAPALVGRYRVVRWVGGGGMGDVYLAQDPNLDGRPVAVKVPRLLSIPEHDERARLRFLQEAASASRVPHHAHVCPVYDYGQHDGRPFLVMAYVEGGSLADRLKAAGRFQDPREAVRLTRSAADGLAALHAAGVIHRDLKPGNILVGADGSVLLTDFGLARVQADDNLTPSGAVLGTPSYMAPEWVRGRTAASTTAADVYSMGAVLYHLLTGRPPYQGEVVQVIGQLAVSEPPDAASLRPDLDPALVDILRRCMVRRPEDRPTAAGFAELLGDWLERAPATERLPATAELPAAVGDAATRQAFAPPAAALREPPPAPAGQRLAGLAALRSIAKPTDRVWPLVVERGTDDARGRSYTVRDLGPPPRGGEHPVRLGSRVLWSVLWDRDAHLLLLDEAPDGKVFCLCPSWFVPDARLRAGRTLLPPDEAHCEPFVVTGTPGREHLLAIISEQPIGLDWMPADPSVPARIVTQNDIDHLMVALGALPPGSWAALITYCDVVID
jgi:hypothetical protein